MIIRFHFLRDPTGPLRALRGDGWDLEGEADWEVEASHPDVTAEAAARERLDGLGLLTSRNLLIRFDHFGRLARVSPPASPSQS
jgi:hypothetical protein